MLDKSPTPPKTLTRARRIALDNGIRHAYTGNVHDKSGESTYCHQCGQLLIGRDWYVLSEWNLSSTGACNKCGTICPGVFANEPGDWGAKRKVIQLKDYAI